VLEQRVLGDELFVRGRSLASPGTTAYASRVRIDAMTEADVGAVVAIDSSATHAQLAEEIVRPWSRIWVAREDDGAPLAFLLLWHVVDELHLLNIATRADRRRGGIGRALMETMLAYGREHDARHVFLEVRRSNAPAIALYRKLGFEQLGVRARYYPDGEDALEMVLRLRKLGEEAT
jgi:ribosomal-protein-alanine N-acetyltransferase